MKLLLMLAHSVEEYDQVRLLSELCYDVFSLGGYIDPARPHDAKRPALPDVSGHPELKAVVDALGTSDNLEAAKRHLPEALIEWADAIICHHYEHTWILPQWDRIKHKRVVWRTVGQSTEHNERLMAPLREEGLQIVRYSPKERNIPGYCGEDALIRFYKDLDEWDGWSGAQSVVVNFAQELKRRGPYTNWEFWKETTRGLPVFMGGPGTEEDGGPGEVPWEKMREALRQGRCYLYTGTQPAAYTLGLVEAMMVGIPVVSIGPKWMGVFPYGPDLFEGHEIAGSWYDDPAGAHDMLGKLLADYEAAWRLGCSQRDRAIDLFGKDKIAAQWKEFLEGAA